MLAGPARPDADPCIPHRGQKCCVIAAARVLPPRTNGSSQFDKMAVDCFHRCRLGAVTVVRTMPDQPAPDAVVLRLRPMGEVAALIRQAEKSARRSDGKRHHSLSVWADAAHDGESRQQVIERLLDVTKLVGMAAEKNRHYWFCSTATEITTMGFHFEKDDYPGEPPEHYSVVLGDPPTEADVERFISAFNREQRRDLP